MIKKIAIGIIAAFTVMAIMETIALMTWNILHYNKHIHGICLCCH